MSNQSFDSNGTSSASSSDSGEAPIPIAQQLSQQSYLCNIQHKMDALLKASGAEASDETEGSALPSSAISSLGASPSKSSAPKRVNKMDSFFAQAAAEEEAAAEELAAKLAAEAEARNAEAESDTDDGTEPLPIEANSYDEVEHLPADDTYAEDNTYESADADSNTDDENIYDDGSTYAEADNYDGTEPLPIEANSYDEVEPLPAENTYVEDNTYESADADSNTDDESSYDGSTYAEAENYDSNEPPPIDDTQQEAAFNQMDSVEAPVDVPQRESRPTGYAGLSAGLAAAGLGNFAARLAQESTSTSDDEFVPDEPQSSAEPP